tara:strand:+ start:360 stop:3029 length:2670 start_codon:yes stop_codon:yes gene_type:complete
MSKPLVIVESPTKVKTISKILGPDYIVSSCVGHIRDLPRTSKDVPVELKDKCMWNAVIVEKNFENIYVVPDDRKKIVSDLKKMASKASELYLATDDDREGEAIAWHLKELLEPNSEPKRITFNEITESAIKAAIEKPGVVNLGKFKSWEARRTLDRMIGYEISPKLRDLGGAFISTGRVQGPAVRLIVEREEERLGFVKAPYFELRAECKSLESSFVAEVKSVENKKLATGVDFDNQGKILNDNKKYLNKEESLEISKILTGGLANISKIKEVSRTAKPPKPLKTTSLQSSARNKFGFQPQKTMSLAQKLYNEGFITYMRTDSIRLSDIAIKASRDYISEHFKKELLPPEPRVYKDKKNSQAAHEAIRPSGEKFKSPDDISSKFKEGSDEHKLYSLIFNTTVASQMEDAKGITKNIEIEVQDSKFAPIILSVSGTSWIFKGYRELIQDANEKIQNLPNLKEGEKITILETVVEEKYTTPPNRYSSVGLVKKLEELGIGRPSTYVQILNSISSVFIRSESSLVPRIIALAKIWNFMKPHFSKYIDYEYTKLMEDSLDSIAESSDPDKARINFLSDAYKIIGKHIADYEEAGPSPNQLTTVAITDTSIKNISIKTGRIRDRIAYPYLLREDGENASLPNEITIEEIDQQLITDAFVKKERERKLERKVGSCGDCEEVIHIKLGPSGPYIQHGEKVKGKRQKKCIYKNLMGPIFNSEDPNGITIEEAKKRFYLSSKNPRKLGDEEGWEYYTAVGQHGGFGIRSRARQKYENETLKTLSKKDLLEIGQEEEITIPKSYTKEKIIDKIINLTMPNEKELKNMSKEEVVSIAREFKIRVWMTKLENAKKETLLEKILVQKETRTLEKPEDALSIELKELIELFKQPPKRRGTQKS